MTTPVSLRLYDSLRGQKVPFEPLEPGKVKMYLCGPTTYAPAHIGHAYSAIAFDTIRRSLKWLGYDVKFVRNVTDVDDKIIKRANELGEDPMALAARFAEDYNRDMARFGITAPDVEPKVSGHIDEIIAIIGKLIGNGKAYASHGDVYFEVDTFPAYGKLSGQSLDDLRAGARIEVDERKRAAPDFALWKAAKPGEPFWPSPWGNGRPGWHIECSAMTMAHLGETFDLHGGGKDLIFPHHENEIAQSQGAHGDHTFARYWMHNGFLNFAGEKMSKSLGNVFNCDQIAQAVGGEALRFFCVSHHYRSPVDFEIESIRDAAGTAIGVRFNSLETADRRLEYFYLTLQRIDTFLASNPGDDNVGNIDKAAVGWLDSVRDALADDFNSPVAIAIMGDAAKLANKFLDSGKGINKDDRRRTLASVAENLRDVGHALGVFENGPSVYLSERRARLVKRHSINVARVQELLAERTTARADKNFARADEIRGELTALNVEMFDAPGGTDWRVRDEG